MALNRENLPKYRIAMVDVGRGAALIAMTIYHFTWDLAMFGLIDTSFPFSAGMIWFARAIAGSFLFLVGFSLFLAHGERIRWRPFLMRLATIVGAALLITIATYFATPDDFIFFGILHAIAVASIFGLAFLRLPWWLIAIFAAFFIFAGDTLRSPALDTPIWWWTGLSSIIPRSNDFVPIFPFFGMVVAGIAAAKLASGRDWLEMAGRWPATDRLSVALRFIGRHSLIYYLLHQPVMIGLLWIATRLSGHI